MCLVIFSRVIFFLGSVLLVASMIEGILAVTGLAWPSEGLPLRDASILGTASLLVLAVVEAWTLYHRRRGDR